MPNALNAQAGRAEVESVAAVVASLARQRSWVAGTLYGSAAVLVGVSVLVSWEAHRSPLVSAGVAAAGAVVSVAFLVVVARGVDLPVWVHAVTAALGSVLVGALVIAAGPTFAGPYGLLILYVVAFSLYYFPVPLALAQVGLAAAAYAVALAVVPGELPRLSYWLLVVGACVIGSGLVGILGHRSRRLLELEHAAAGRLADLDRSKDAFLRLVAHDLRGPLSNIIGNAELIAAHLSELDPDMVHDLAKRQARQGRRLERLVGDLLDLERLRSRAANPERSPVRLDELVVNLGEAMEWGQRPVSLEVEEVWVSGDATLLERAVDNLLANAIKHTPDGSPIDIELTRNDAQARLVIADRGPGVPAEQHETIFELFSSATSGGRATGVGLALVHEIVRTHQGQVTVADRPGGGARFTIVLPTASAPNGR